MQAAVISGFVHRRWQTIYFNTQSAPRLEPSRPATNGTVDGIDDHLVRINGGLGSPAVSATDVSYNGPPAIVYTGITTRSMAG
jgi:hypothetical protein